MTSTTTYGDFPGVQVSTTGGAITGVVVGREQNLVIIGNGDSSGSASVNTATQISSRGQAPDTFGSGTELSTAMQEALDNGANIDFLYGIRYDELTATEEDITSGGDAADSSAGSQISNNPIIEDTSLITVEDDTDTELTVEFRYEPTAGDLSTPSDSDTIFINPITGAWKADASDNYDITYDYPDWTAALDEAETVIEVEDVGIINPLTEAEDIASDLSGRLNTLRGNYKMAMGVQAAQPNGNESDDNGAFYDTSNYTDAIDNDAMYLHAPARKDGSTELITPAVSGTMAGNDLDDSIYNDTLTTDDLDQFFSDSEADDMRDEEVIPVIQPPSGGTIFLDDNLSTSQDTDWQRDYWRRRIVDQVILIAKQVGDSVIGRINDSQTRSIVEDQLSVELRGLVEDRLIDPNTDDTTAWFVDVYEVSADEVGVDIGITPTGIVKRIDTSITINTN